MRLKRQEPGKRRVRYASAEISVGCKMKSIGRLCLGCFPDDLLDLFQEHGARRFEDFSFVTRRKFDLGFLCPKTQVGDVRAVTESVAETADQRTKSFACMYDSGGGASN